MAKNQKKTGNQSGDKEKTGAADKTAPQTNAEALYVQIADGSYDVATANDIANTSDSLKLFKLDGDGKYVELTADEVAAAKAKDPAALVTLDTAADTSAKAATEKVVTLSEHIVTAAKAAQADANHASHGALENFLVHLTEFKAKLVAVEDEVEGEVATLLSRIKAIL
ncbi:hypothetical protein [Sideroxydans lithotrophicus]|uniref:Uncharacterized protein n=1 Tax=Sideroxydans lithotrophicus (strain ES-1) TaxID=580332 RepID=D5CT60_SIDLE|nr:hypothetical protein [Sideroxydans lithotrophicus]ADE12146.1 hypothetical protein Slit_1917 [Sideroxydans lithotrophicus ES-1]